MMPKSKRLYVGMTVDRPWEVFWAVPTPTNKSHGHLYPAVIGPFRTKAGATFMAKYGRNNPHCQCVSEAERLARKESAK
jgi:hypothetical protein